ncbi:MAG: ABC transporter ATP-binding protein, partial [Candidatus Bathyarchaeota archaeon]|nr:ABC transporter ATP-binding protein [Candidatus Bathyarchaeota archaeon]
DAVARRNVWAVLRELVEQGKTIVLTTHIMEEAEMVSDRLAIIHKGVVVAEGTPEQIKSLAKEKFRIVIEGSLKDLGLTEKSNHIVRFGSKHIIYVKNEDEAIELVRKAIKKGLKAETSPVTLEDVFVSLVGGEMN